MKVFLVVFAIFLAAAWANEVEEQDETELMEVEDSGYYPKVCYRTVCSYTKKCNVKLVLKDVCRKYCNTVKKCSKRYSKYYDPYGGYPPKVHCVPVTTCKRVCHKQPDKKTVCKPKKSCKKVPKKCHNWGWKHHGRYY